MNSLTPEQEAIATETSHAILANVVSASWKNRDHLDLISKIISDAIARALEDTALPIGKSGPPCCGKVESVKWNQFNGVVQCHSCGTIYEAQSEDTARLITACEGLLPFVKCYAPQYTLAHERAAEAREAIDAARKKESEAKLKKGGPLEQKN